MASIRVWCPLIALAAIAITFAHVDHVTTTPLGFRAKGTLRQLAPKNVSMHVTFGCNLQFDFVPWRGSRRAEEVPIASRSQVAGCRFRFGLLPKFKDQIDSPFGSSRCEMRDVRCELRLCIVTLDQFGLQLHT